MNALQQGSAPPPIDAQRTSEQQKQSAIDAVQNARQQRNSADREVASQHLPSLPRSRSHSRTERARVPRTILTALNEHEESTPLQQSANTFESAATSHTVLEPTQEPEQSQSPHIRFKNPPGAYVDSSFVHDADQTHTHAPLFDNDDTHSFAYRQEDDFDPGNHIDDTLLDVTKDFELNLNDLVTNALRRKSNTDIETLEQFSALDEEDFATKVAQYPHSWFRAVIAVQQSHHRAEEAIDQLSEDINALEGDAIQDERDLKSLRDIAQRRDTRLEQCKKIINQQQETLALQQNNIAEMQAKIAHLEGDRGRNRTPSRPRSSSRGRSWSPSQITAPRRQSPHRKTNPIMPSRPSEAPSGLTHTTNTSGSSSSRPLRVPDPPEFDNKSSVSFSQWKVKMRIKLFTSGDYEDRSEQAKLDYILSRTGGSVFERLLMRMPDSPNHSLRFLTAQECLDQLNDWYGDRHKQARAYTEFENLAQNYNESFEDFLTRFQECSAYMGLSDEHEMQKLQHKLNSRYGQRINDGTYYASLKDVIRRGDALDAHFIFQDAQKKPVDRERRPPRQRNASTSSTSSYGSSRSSTSNASTTASSVTALPRLTDELRQKLRAEGRCFRCREKGHTSFNCPKNTNRVNNVNHLAIMPATDDAVSEAGGVPLTRDSENE
jgi:hypothetical protein